MHQFERHRRITTNDSVLFPNIIAVVGHIRIDTRTVVVSRTVMVLQFESPRTWCSVLDIVSAHRFFTSDWSHLTTLMPLGQGRWPGSWRTGAARCYIAFSAMDLVKAKPVLKNPAANYMEQLEGVSGASRNGAVNIASDTADEPEIACTKA